VAVGEERITRFKSLLTRLKMPSGPSVTPLLRVWNMFRRRAAVVWASTAMPLDDRASSSF